eukprot:TRINITY_DN24327_c0_g1_i1.p1 TRINITY_DN24327_c0_g1~~TRINITY_DN24327_c0_g1_i1.p1  ORF type:complete len:375 (-),score=22.15 TRINITY_DN24327_c0_g1_i1:274-1398(-)
MKQRFRIRSSTHSALLFVNIFCHAHVSGTDAFVDCTVHDRSCTYYRDCVEALVPCGPTGYALGYGEHYCHAFEEKFAMRNDAVEDWMWATMKCLQSRLQPDVVSEMTCPEIKQFAFSTHPTCYTDNGVMSVCDLGLVDWLEIFSVLRPRDIVFPDAVKQMVETLHACTRKLVVDSYPGCEGCLWLNDEGARCVEDKEWIALDEYACLSTGGIYFYQRTSHVSELENHTSNQHTSQSAMGRNVTVSWEGDVPTCRSLLIDGSPVRTEFDETGWYCERSHTKRKIDSCCAGSDILKEVNGQPKCAQLPSEFEEYLNAGWKGDVESMPALLQLLIVVGALVFCFCCVYALIEHCKPQESRSDDSDREGLSAELSKVT